MTGGGRLRCNGCAMLATVTPKAVAQITEIVAVAGHEGVHY